MTVQSKASLLQTYAMFYGAPQRANEELLRFQQVTVDDVRRVAATYLIRENRTVVLAQPLATEAAR